MSDVCPDCGSKDVFSTIKGSSLVIECKKCGWSVATTWTEPINEDETIYSLSLLPGNSAAKPTLSAVAKIAGTNFLGAKEMLANAGETIVKCGAVEMKERAKTLKDAGVSFKIFPEYPWEY